MNKPSALFLRRLAIFALALMPIAQAQTVFWNEANDGDLSDTQGSPNSFSLVTGANRVLGNVNGSNDFQDWLTLTVPAGFELTGVTLAAYNSADGQGFTGVQSGSTFAGDPFTAGSYLGYAHYGTSAQNGSLPTANLVGANLLPIMGDNVNASPGSQGFTPPLPAGSYSFVIQQLGATTAYTFDYTITPVPEPRAQAAIALLCGAWLVIRRRMRKAG